MANKDILADEYRPLPGQEAGSGKITLRDLLSFLIKDDNKKSAPRGSRSDDYRNLSSGVNLTPQSFGLEYRQPATPVQPQAKVFDIPAVRQEQPEDSRMTTDSMSFGDAFRTYRNMMGPGAIFMWNGKQYTTDLAEEVAAPKPAPLPTQPSIATEPTTTVSSLLTDRPYGNDGRILSDGDTLDFYDELLFRSTPQPSRQVVRPMYNITGPTHTSSY